MKNWEEDDGTEYCTAKEDYADAQAVANKLGIKLHGANFASEYWDNVFEHFLEEYRCGRTPNPDILCNREIKFRAFLDYALTLGADYIATGHYTRRGETDGKGTLLKGLDANKDQSYFLHAVGHRELEKTLFPVGQLEKPAVRKLAEQHDLITHNKKDSTGICFIGERRFSDFLKQYIPAQAGEIHGLDGEVLGQHQGLMYHTLGQRQGLGIGGTSKHGDAPWYVVRKNRDDNVLLVAQGNEHPALFSSVLYTGEVYWVAGTEPDFVTRGEHALSAKVRYRQPDQECTLKIIEGGYQVNFSAAQRAVTPGQSVVFYAGDRCLGGGVIERAEQ
ncbi:UNVERIFIED_CONTAM: hypothetical protein GTU68_034784 [Idotea baltica]|nr:hypothetical protein [Idotea baltica]